MENILVFGKGDFYKKNEAQIKEKYLICGFLDNNMTTNEDKRVYNPKETTAFPRMKILIMVSLIEQIIVIIKQLREIDISVKDIIIGINEFYCSDLARRRVQNGQLIICDDGIKYVSKDIGEIKCDTDDDIRRIDFLLERKYKPLPPCMKQLELAPLNHDFAYGRGTPIMRRYIDEFLMENKQYIRGDVMEIGDDRYTRKYGGNKVINSYVLHVEDGENYIKGDLQTGEGICDDMADCFILTQVLEYIYDIQNAAKNIMKALKKDGVALITVSGISQISKYDMDRWGEYWRFTDRSLKRLFAEIVGEDNVQVHVYGNVKTAVLKLYGACAEELDKEEFAYVDSDYQVMISAVIRKGQCS